MHNTKRWVGARLATCDGKGKSREKNKTQGSEWWSGGRWTRGRRALTLEFARRHLCTGRDGSGPVLGAGCWVLTEPPAWGPCW